MIFTYFAQMLRTITIQTSAPLLVIKLSAIIFYNVILVMYFYGWINNKPEDHNSDIKG